MLQFEKLADKLHSLELSKVKKKVDDEYIKMCVDTSLLFTTIKYT